MVVETLGYEAVGAKPDKATRRKVLEAIDQGAAVVGLVTMRQRQKGDAAAIRCQKSPKNKVGVPKRKKGPNFYHTEEWMRLRYAALKAANGRCMICGASAHEDGIRLMVDHIIALSVDWSKRLDPDNVQVACSSCNWGKLASSGDFRPDWFTKELVMQYMD